MGTLCLFLKSFYEGLKNFQNEPNDRENCSEFVSDALLFTSAPL